MADDYVAEQLCSWGFSDLIPKFKEEGVDKEALLSLKPELIAQLVPRIGDRAKFLKRIEDLEKTNESSVFCSLSLNTYSLAAQTQEHGEFSQNTTVSDVINLNLEESQSLLSDGKLKGRTVSQDTLSDIFELNSESESLLSDGKLKERTISSSLLSETNALQSTPKRRKLDTVTTLDWSKKKYLSKENCNILEILLNDTQGLIVLNNYKSVQTLTHPLRKKLVDVVINYCIKTYGRLTNADFEHLAVLIVEDFPSEAQEIYYVPPCIDGQGPKISSGKLPNKYRNLVRLLKNAEVIPCKPKLSIEAVEDCKAPTREQQEKINFLKYINDPWPTVETFWRETYEERRNSLKNNKGGIVFDIIEEWPSLKQPLGFTLIDADFHQQYPQLATGLLSNWPLYKDTVVSLLLQNVKQPGLKEELSILNVDRVHNDVTDAIILRLLPVLFSSPLIRTKEAKDWRPSLPEQRQSFLHHVKVQGEIKVFLEDRKRKLLRYSLTLQPLIVVVGDIQPLGHLSTYVILDNLMYKVSSPLAGVDICFKIFHFFNAKYPKETEQMWSFIQKFYYKLNSKCDRKFSGVFAIMNDIKNMQNNA